jgi:hypothetical protein
MNQGEEEFMDNISLGNNVAEKQETWLYNILGRLVEDKCRTVNRMSIDRSAKVPPLENKPDCYLPKK